MHAATYDEQAAVWTQKIPYQQYYSVQSVCTILGVGSPSIYGAIHRGTLKGYRVGGVAHIKHEDLVAYIARRNTIPTVDRLSIEAILPRVKATTVEDIVGNIGNIQAIPPRSASAPNMVSRAPAPTAVTDLFDDDDDDETPAPVTAAEATEAVPAS